MEQRGFFNETKSNEYSNKFLNEYMSKVLDEYKNGEIIKKDIIVISEKHFNNNNGFGIYRCINIDDDEEKQFTIKGNSVSQLLIGQSYQVKGKVCTNTYNGFTEKQLSIINIHAIRPINKRGIVSYLQSLKGLKTKAELIYDTYGNQSIEMLLNNPLEVSKRIGGIGKKSVLKWQEQLKDLQDSQSTIAKLLDFGLTIKQARKLYSDYNDSIIDEIEKNPYFLAAKVKGYGFKSCDRIAKNMGYDLKSNFRLSEGIIYTLNEASTEGHSFLPLNVLIERCKDVLDGKLTVEEMKEYAKSENEKEYYSYGNKKAEIDIKKVRELLNLYNQEKDYFKRDQYRYVYVDIEECDIVLQFESLKKKKIIIENVDDVIRVYLVNLYYDELSVAYNVLRLSNEEYFPTYVNIEQELDKYLKSENIILEEKQRKAVLEFSKYKSGFYVLNGSAGCGKTFTLKIILDMLRLQFRRCRKDMKVKVFAPTGKAAKVATKATGLSCSTVHRGLGYSPVEGFSYNKENPLKTDVLIVDESSMLDVFLTRNLLEAIETGTKVIFIGDTKQLPSVGPGNVLKDIIESQKIKTVTLNVVKRQDLLSDILRNANNIIDKKMIINYNNTNDAFVIFKETPFETQDYIMRSIRRVIKTKNFNLEDIQVLCPQKSSSIGTITMNYLIQKEFNPDNNDIVVLNKKFELKTQYETKEVCLNYKKNDKVIHMKNNYDMEWYTKNENGEYIKDKFTGITNGETGVIQDIIKIKENSGDTFIRIIVRYEDKYVFYDDVFDELEHAYALTIHKSQGSQWKAVIIPILNQNFKMLDNNLLYTAYTRAEEFNVVIGQNNAIAYAINNSKIITRYTSLKDKLIS